MGLAQSSFSPSLCLPLPLSDLPPPLSPTPRGAAASLPGASPHRDPADAPHLPGGSRSSPGLRTRAQRPLALRMPRPGPFPQGGGALPHRAVVGDPPGVLGPSPTSLCYKQKENLKKS